MSRIRSTGVSASAFITFALFALVLGTHAARGESLEISVNNAAIRIAAISPTIFRVTVKTSGDDTKAQRSIFLDPALKPGDVGQTGDAGGHRQLKTSAGSIDADPATGMISLLDSHGIVLIPPAPITTPGPAEAKATLDLHVGWPADQNFSVYGSGNGIDSLVRHQVEPRVDNGIAVMPFFWAKEGFATFVVGDDDNYPAQCNGHIDSTGDTHFVTWSVPGRSADLYLMIAPTLGDATSELLSLTGRPPVPPRWTMGYMQSRWGWVDRAYIDDALKQFQTRQLPVDAFIFDFEWYTTHPDYTVKPEGLKGFSDFDWNAALFPDPAEQVKAFHQAGIHVVCIRKPRLGNSDTLAMIRSNGWGFEPTGTRRDEKMDVRGLWFANPDARSWYAKQLQPLLQKGIDGWWDDEGEFTYSNYIYWNMAERAALDAVHPEARLWTIDRAFQPGLARLGAAAWTGDVQASWHDFLRTPTDLLNWSVAGMPFVASDIGGYAGQTTPELLVRWMEAGTFFPVMRAHSEFQAKPHFPWLFGNDAEAAIRKALDLRYRLVPVLYSLAHHVHETGEPIMRPLIMQYPADANVAELSSEWLVGQDLLAAPVLTPGGHRDVYLPDDIWYDFATNEKIEGGRKFSLGVPFDAVPLYVRGGTILTLAPVLQHTEDLPGGPLDVHVYAGRDGTFRLMEDDGLTNAYLSGDLRQTTFAWNDASRTLSWSRSGPYDGHDCFRSMTITVHDGVKHAATQPVMQQKLAAATGSVVIPR